ncbi:hypothetical protein ACFV3E_08040 [Streptomyces sp. NPDC059718]
MPAQPDLNNPAFGFDTHDIQVTDNDAIPSGLVLTASLPITVSVTFEVGGFMLPLLHDTPFRVTYAFAALSGTDDFTCPVDGRLVTLPAPAKTLYSGADTAVTVPANTLRPGLYQVSAVIQFPGATTMGAFATLPVIEVVEGP